MGDSALRRAFAYLLFSRFAAKLLVFCFFVMAARRLGPGQFGIFSFHIVLAQILSHLADLGLSTTSMRDAARATGQRTAVFGYALAAKLCLVVPLIIVAPAAARFASPSGDSTLGYLAVGVVILDSFSSFFLGPFRLREDLRPVALADLTRAIVSLTAFGMAHQATPTTALLAYLVGALFGCAVPVALLFHRGEFQAPRFVMAGIVKLMRPSVLIGLTSGLYMLGNRVDVLILEIYKGSTEVGIYNSAYAFFTNMSEIPLMVSTILFPRFAASAMSDPARTRSLVQYALAPLLAVGVPVAVCGPVMAKSIIGSVYGGDYRMAGPLLEILLVAAGLVFLGNVLWYLLIASNKQVHHLAFVSAALGANVVLNLILVPRIAALGAAVATLVMEVILVVLSAFALRMVITIRDLGRCSLSPMICASATALLCYPFRTVHAFYLLPAAGVLYIGLLWVTSRTLILGKIAGFPFNVRDPAPTLGGKLDE